MFYIKKQLYIIVLNIFILTTACAPEAGPGTELVSIADSSRLSELLRDDSTDRFPKAIEVRDFAFPGDHGPHDTYRNEWWYFTGNLDGAAGRRFGFELTLFRFSLAPALPAPLESAWQTRQVFIGHFAVTDVANKQFHVAQRYSRGAAGLAGATSAPVAVWLDDWRIEQSGNRWRLSAGDDRFAIDLELAPLKPVVLNGDRGLSRKSAEVGNASYYYSIPRLETAGQVRVGAASYDVAGLSWLDREWGSSALAADQQGWDWFALQLSDGSDLMVYQIRGPDGRADGHSSGTLVDLGGEATPLGPTDFAIEVLDVWESELGGSYPSGWRVTIPARDLSLQIDPVIANQELVTNVRYWEGAVDVSGRSAGRAVSGRGYVELTGYANP